MDKNKDRSQAQQPETSEKYIRGVGRAVNERVPAFSHQGQGDRENACTENSVHSPEKYQGRQV